MIGVGVSILIETVLFPTPNVFRADVWWITTIVAPAYILFAFLVGVVVVALVAATAGGILRDVLIGAVPPAALVDPAALYCQGTGGTVIPG